MRYAIERLAAGELSPRFTHSRERYGHSFALVAFGRRLIVDLPRRQ